MPSSAILLALTAPYPLPPRETFRGRVLRWSLWTLRVVVVCLAAVLAFTLRAVGVSLVITAALGLLVLAFAAAALVLPAGLLALVCWRCASMADFRARFAAGFVVES